MLLAVTLTISLMATAAAQEPGYDVPQSEHSLLASLAGEWRFERQSPTPDGADAQTLGTGTITAEMVGEFFVVSRWSGEVYGAGYEAVQLLGYDIEQEKYTGSWIDSFLSFQWDLSGTLDEASQELTIMTSGPAPTGGTAKFRERYQFTSADSITIIGEMQQGETWVPITMTLLTH